VDSKLFCSEIVWWCSNNLLLPPAKLIKLVFTIPRSVLLGDLASSVYPASLVQAFTPDRASIFTLFDIGRLRHLITAALDFFFESHHRRRPQPLFPMSEKNRSDSPPPPGSIPIVEFGRPLAGRQRASTTAPPRFRDTTVHDSIVTAQAQRDLVALQLQDTQRELADTLTRLGAQEHATAANATPPQFPPEWLASMRDRDRLIQQLTDARDAEAAAFARERAELLAHIAADGAVLEAARAQHFLDVYALRDRAELEGRLREATAHAREANHRADARTHEASSLSARLHTAELREAAALHSIIDLRTATQQLQDRLAALQGAQNGAGATALPAPPNDGLTPTSFSRAGSPLGSITSTSRRSSRSGSRASSVTNHQRAAADDGTGGLDDEDGPRELQISPCEHQRKRGPKGDQPGP
jgi:hypothetical protein